MSGEDITSVLLPSSGIDFFLLDEKTSALVEQLKADWRFARVNINVEKAGIDEAVAKYGGARSPELIIIETGDIGEAFIAFLSICNPVFPFRAAPTTGNQAKGSVT